MKKKVPKIADSEWRIMRVLWKMGPQTANDVVQALSGEVEWNPRTIKTLIGRLVKKGAIKVTDEGVRYRYRAAVDESACVRTETRNFLRRVTTGAMSPALAAFLEGVELSPREIDELQEILEKKRED